MIRKVLMLVIAVAVLVSGYTLFNRYQVEKNNSKIEIAVDMSDFQDLASEIGASFKDMAQDLIHHGATSIAVHETTLTDLKNRGNIAYMPLSDLITGDYSTGVRVPIAERIIQAYKQKANSREISNYSVLMTQDADVYNFLSNSLAKRVAIDTLQEKNEYAIIIKQKLRNLNTMGLGFLAKDIEYAKSLGFKNVIPRVQNFQGITEEEINYKIDQLKKYNISTVVFEGDSVLGYDPNQDKDPVLMKYAAKKFADNGLIASIIEKPADEDVEKGQKGITIFSKESGYFTNKVFAVDLTKLKSFTVEDIVDQWARAIAERNVRIVYVRPLYNPDRGTGTVLKDTLDGMDKINNRIEKMGYIKGIVRPVGNFLPKGFERLIIFAGISAGVLMLLLGFIEFNVYVVYSLLILAIAGFASVMYSTMLFNHFEDLLVKISALVASIVFSSLAGFYCIQMFKKYFKAEEKPVLARIVLISLGVLLCAVGIATIGGMMVASMLAESKYLLKLDIFRGVKIAFVTPMILFIAYFIKEVGIYSDKDGNPINPWLQLKKLFNTSVTVKYVVTSLIILAVLVILLLRSGNAPAQLSTGAEKGFRAALENFFVARPRSKDLLTFPLLMLLVYAAIRKEKIISFFVMFAGMIGLADIVNSFSHIRMPLSMAVLSTIYSVVISVVIGIVLIVLWNFINVKYFKDTRGETH